MSNLQKLFLRELPPILDIDPYVVYVIDEKGKYIRRATKEDLEKLDFIPDSKHKLFDIYKT